MKNSLFNIFTYSDFKKLLSDFHRLKNEQMKGIFSFRAFAKRAGFGAPNYIQHIIAGKKRVSNTAVHQLAVAMKLNKKEHAFFEALVAFNQAKSDDEKVHRFEKLISFKAYAQAQTIGTEQYEYFSRWYYVAIRELVNLEGFKDDAAWVAKQLNPKISSLQASDALQVLKRLKLITKNEKGEWIAHDPHIATEREVASLTAAQFHKQMIKCGYDALEQDSSIRDISSLTMSLSEEEFSEVKKRIGQFREEIQDYLSKSTEKAERVCQLNYQFFHLTHPGKREKSKKE